MASYPTSSNDYIVVDTPDETLDALAGDDTVLVVESGAVVNGGEGDDWLSTSLDVIVEESEDEDGDGYPDSGDEATTELRGDAGDDHIHAHLRVANPDWAAFDFTARLAGGDGDDQLWLDMVGEGIGFDAKIDGGVGKDDIQITSIFEGTLKVFGPIAVDAGGDDDNVNVYSYGYSESDVPDVSVTVRAGGGNDSVESYSSSVGLDSGGGENHLYGGSGNDTLAGTAEGGADFGGGFNEADGGSGNDRITLTAHADGGLGASNANIASGGTGDDWIKVIAGNGAADHDGASSAENTVSGGGGDDTVEAELSFTDENYGTNKIHGDDGADQLTATLSFERSTDYPITGEAMNLLYGDDGNDRLTVIIRGAEDVEDGDIFIHSELFGGEGRDTLTVEGGEGNELNGNQDNDTLIGGDGSDRLIGGQGDDDLRGNGGADEFVFGYVRDGERDTIRDFTFDDDVIDISGIDANAFRSGNQSFRFSDEDGWHGTGRVWVEDTRGSSSILYADTGKLVLEVLLRDGRGVDASDYHADDFLL